MLSYRFNPDQSLSASSSTQSPASGPSATRAYEYPDSVLLKLARRPKTSSTPIYGSSWDTRIPLTYGDCYGHLKWMKEYDEFCIIVEKNRISAANRKYETLVAISARSVSKNLHQISADALACLPDHVLDLVADEIMADPRVLTTLKDAVWDSFPIRTLQRIWDGLYESQQINLHLWKVISPRLRAAKTNSGKELRLYRFEQQIEFPEQSDSFCAFTNPLVSNTFEFITSLSIGHLLPMMEYIRLSSIVNLGILEISECSDRRGALDTPSPVIDFDRVFRAWAAKAEIGTAFQVLRSVTINILDSSLTTDILPHLNKFPALAIVYPGRILSPATKNGRKNKGKYISDYDFRSIRPLLPPGWKGVTIRGSKNGRMRDVADSTKPSPAFNEKGKPYEIEFPSKYRVQRDFRFEMEKDAHNSLPTLFSGRPKERHCLHELLDFELQQRLSDDSRQQILGLNTSGCVTPDAHVLWPGNFLQEFPEEISTHEQLAEAVTGFQRAQEAAARPKATSEDHDGQQARCRATLDKGDRGYSISNEKVRLQEFGKLGMIRLDADLKALGMDAGPAMLCVDENRERMLKVESKAPVASLRIGEPQKWRSEGQTVLVREDLPTEEEKRRAKRKKEQEKEELKAWVRPLRRKKKEPEVKPKDKEAEKERKRERFDESFWNLTGMAPSKRNKTD